MTSVFVPYAFAIEAPTYATTTPALASFSVASSKGVALTNGANAPYVTGAHSLVGTSTTNLTTSSAATNTVLLLSSQLPRHNEDKQVNILKELGCKYMRGHSLVWEKLRSGIGTNLVPPFVGDIMNDKEKLDNAITCHMNHIINKYKDYITDWDVANEMSANTLFRDIHGQGYIKDWFNWATEINPQGCYFYNEYQHGNEFFDILKFMQDNNVKCDHIGLQSHYDGYQPMPDELFALWDKITSYGFRLKVTELSISNRDQILMGNYMRDFMIAAFSYEKMDGIYMWGYWDDSNIKPYAPLYRSDWSLRESGQVYEDLVYNKWWTEEETRTDDNGEASVRGFYGNYDITVEYEGKTHTVCADFYKGEENILKIVL